MLRQKDKELIETSKGATTIADPVFLLWFKREYMS